VTEDLLQLSDPAYKPEPRADHSVDAVSARWSFGPASC
jgi:hypothetical protein